MDAVLHGQGAQLRRADPVEREDYGFAPGGLVSSFALLLIMVVLSQTE